MTCKFTNVCWRRAYTDYFKIHTDCKVPPDRLTIMLDNLIDETCYPRGGIFAENMPVWRNGNLINKCPLLNYATCDEYIKFSKKYASMERVGRHNLRKTIPKEIRNKVAEQCRYKCSYCGVPINQMNPLTGKRIGGAIDHIIPLSKGGTDDIENLTLACTKCNSEKSDKDPEYFNKRIER